MVTALIRAFAALPTPPLRRVVGLSLTLAAASFLPLAAGAALFLDSSAALGWQPLRWLVDLLGEVGI